MTLLRYTGHPFVDVGIATITAFVNRSCPEDISYDDLEYVASELKELYCRLKPLQNYLTMVFHGSGFVQPKFTVEQKEDYAEEVLFAFRPNRPKLDNVSCTFFPEQPAVMRAFRQHIPLLNGQTIGNFSARGMPGIPIGGVALLAVHALPLGCFRSEHPRNRRCKYLLAFHQPPASNDSGEAQMNRVMATRALNTNLKAIHFMRQGQDAELPTYGVHVRTRYVDELLRAKQAIQRRRASLSNITGYHFTNCGQGPDIQIIRLDNAILDFLESAQQDASRAWRSVVARGWVRPKGEENADVTEDNTRTWRNSIYESLFNLPYNARWFIGQLQAARDWTLIEIFLRKVMLMEQDRIDTFRELGDRFAHYIDRYEVPSLSFYYRFARAQQYAELRQVVRSACERILKSRAEKPLITYDEFILAFEHPSDGYSQWKLARDLIAFRMIEGLHTLGHKVDLEEIPDEEEFAEENEE